MMENNKIKQAKISTLLPASKENLFRAFMIPDQIKTETSTQQIV